VLTDDKTEDRQYVNIRHVRAHPGEQTLLKSMDPELLTYTVLPSSCNILYQSQDQSQLAQNSTQMNS
jgi:hypothetical protein